MCVFKEGHVNQKKLSLFNFFHKIISNFELDIK